MKKLKKQIALGALAVVLAIAGLAGFGNQSNSTMLQNKKALANVKPIKIPCKAAVNGCSIKAETEDGGIVSFVIPGLRNTDNN